VVVRDAVLGTALDEFDKDCRYSGQSSYGEPHIAVASINVDATIVQLPGFAPFLQPEFLGIDSMAKVGIVAAVRFCGWE